MSRELPMYRGWSNSNDKSTTGKRTTNRGRNYPNVPVLHARLVIDGGDEPQSNVTVKRNSKATAMQSPNLRLVFQPPLDSDKILSKTEKRTSGHDRTHNLTFQAPLEPKYTETSKKVVDSKKGNHRVPVIAGQFHDADTDDTNNNNIQTYMREMSITEKKKVGNFHEDTIISIEDLLSTIEKTMPQTVMFYSIKVLRGLCRGFLGSALVYLLNSEEGGSLFVGVDEDHRAPGLRLTREDRDRVRQLLDSVCLDNIHPAVGAKHVDIEFIPVKTIKDTFVIKITVTMSEILRLCNFRLRGLKTKGYEDGIYKLPGPSQLNSISESAYFSA